VANRVFNARIDFDGLWVMVTVLGGMKISFRLDVDKMAFGGPKRTRFLDNWDMMESAIRWITAKGDELRELAKRWEVPEWASEFGELSPKRLKKLKKIGVGNDYGDGMKKIERQIWQL